MFLHFLDRCLVDQRTLEYSRLETVAYFKFFHRLDQFLGKSIINAGLDVKTVRADAGLTGIAVFGNNRPSTAASRSASSKTIKGALPPSSRASANADKGVDSAGLTTTVQPDANAGPAFLVIMTAGKFHGVIAQQTPTGCFVTTSRRSFQGEGMVSP
jgi:hypothetical protein